MQNQAMRLSGQTEQPSKDSLMTLELVDLPQSIDNVTFSIDDPVQNPPWCAECTRKLKSCCPDNEVV